MSAAEHTSRPIVDFHTHILPGMDDGSSSSEESRQMIRASLGYRAGCLVLTPHFYANRDDPERFLRRRNASLARLKQGWTEQTPLLIPGAEITYFEGISDAQELSRMCLGHSRTLLLEMPFCPWTGRILSELTALTERRNYHVVLAHVERYLRFQKKDCLYDLIGAGIRMQANAGFFLHWRTRRKALHMLEDGLIHLLGSDCHNMSSRPPNLGEACRIIEEKCGEEAVNGIMSRSVRLLRGIEVTL